MINAGDLRHLVEIQEVTESRDDDGGISRSWSTIRRRWARIEEQGGRELWRAQQVNPQLSALVRMRYEPIVTTEHRIKYGGRVLNIAWVVNPDGKGIETVALCTEPK